MCACVCSCACVSVCVFVCVCVCVWLVVCEFSIAFLLLYLISFLPDYFLSFLLLYLTLLFHSFLFFFPFPFHSHSLSFSFSYLFIASFTGGILLNLLSKFATCVSDGVDGKGSTDGGVEMNDLYGGARISYIFNEVRTHKFIVSLPLFPFSLPPFLIHLYTSLLNTLSSTLLTSYTRLQKPLTHTSHISYTTYTVGIWPYNAVTGPLRRPRR